MSRARKLFVYFGGFRQTVTDRAKRDVLAAFRRSYPSTGWRYYPEFFEEHIPAETLLDRWRRSRAFLRKCSPVPSVVSILGNSMGCHLAILFAQECQDLGIEIDQITLLAPDPKFRKTKRDIDPAEPSAYAEAEMLWPDANPGEAFSMALRKLRVRRGITYIYSKRDRTAEWHRNVELLPQIVGIEAELQGCVFSSTEDIHDEISKGLARDKNRGSRASATTSASGSTRKGPRRKGHTLVSRFHPSLSAVTRALLPRG